MVKSKIVLSSCPLCKKTITINVNTDLILNSKKHLNPFVLNHCGETILAYIDSDFKVRGIQVVFNALNTEKKEINQDNMKAEPLDYDFVSKLSQDERLIYISNIQHQDLLKMEIPDILDKNLLRIISEEFEISMDLLLKRISVFEKALNKTIDKDLVIKILDRYVKKGIIFKQLLQSDREFLSISGIKIKKGGQFLDENF